MKIQLIEEKTGLNFGLNEVDINKNESRLFYSNADHINSLHIVTEFDKFVAKNKNPELIAEIKRMRHLMNYNEFINEQHKINIDYTGFIENI